MEGGFYDAFLKNLQIPNMQYTPPYENLELTRFINNTTPSSDEIGFPHFSAVRGQYRVDTEKLPTPLCRGVTSAWFQSAALKLRSSLCSEKQTNKKITEGGKKGIVSPKEPLLWWVIPVHICHQRIETKRKKNQIISKNI